MLAGSSLDALTVRVIFRLLGSDKRRTSALGYNIYVCHVGISSVPIDRLAAGAVYSGSGNQQREEMYGFQHLLSILYSCRVSHLIWEERAGMA